MYSLTHTYNYNSTSYLDFKIKLPDLQSFHKRLCQVNASVFNRCNQFGSMPVLKKAVTSSFHCSPKNTKKQEKIIARNKGVIHESHKITIENRCQLPLSSLYQLSFGFWFSCPRMCEKNKSLRQKSVYNMRAREPWQRVMQVRYDSLKMIHKNQKQ